VSTVFEAENLLAAVSGVDELSEEAL